jgi:dephospho-CoA kinase
VFGACQDAAVISVGLTGGIGSGKSAVADRLAALGAVVIDADALARDALAPAGPGEQRVIEQFGAAVVGSDGHLDRTRLAEVVFGDVVARARLEEIVHPIVAERSAALAAAAPPGTVVIHDVPLLVEAGLAERYDLVVVVDAPDEVRRARLMSDRGMSAAEVSARFAAQADRETRLAVADVVIDNSGPWSDLDDQVEELWRELRDRIE